MCQSQLAPINGRTGSCGCCCQGPTLLRRFYSADEQLKHLKTYKDQLNQELAGVEERLKERTDT